MIAGINPIACKGAAGHSLFVANRAPRNFFYGCAVQGAAWKIHGAIVGVGAHQTVNHADRIKPGFPIDIRDQPQACDDVADGDVGRTLAMMFDAYHIVKTESSFGRFVFHPIQRCSCEMGLLARTQNKLDCEGRRDIGVACLFQNSVETGCCLVDIRQRIGEFVCCVTAPAGEHDTIGNAAHVFNQDQPEADGSGPKFANAQGLNLLIGVDEIGE